MANCYLLDIRKMTDNSSSSFMQWHTTKTGEFNHQFSYYLDGQKYTCSSEMLSELILAEFQFRTYAQFKEWSTTEIAQTLQRSNYGSQYGSYSFGVTDKDYLSFKYLMAETMLYLKEASMPGCTLRKLYDDLRAESEWYMRRPLVSNCADRGGCCGRSCGCCEKRGKDLPRHGISAHCTPGCLCCNERRRGQAWSERDLNHIFTIERKQLESSSPFYLQYLASLYFKPLGQGFFDRRDSASSSMTERERAESSGVNFAKRKRVVASWDQFSEGNGPDEEDQGWPSITEGYTKKPSKCHGRCCE